MPAVKRVAVAVLPLALLLPAMSARPEDARFVERSVRVEGETYRYQIYVPSGHASAARWPVILFLHGSGERGSDGVRPTMEGLGPAIRRHPAAFPAIVVFPQARRGHWWDRPMLTQAVAALDAASAEFHGDPDRTYLTGVSMGGNGAWLLAADQPQRFAALVVVAGFAALPQLMAGADGAIAAVLRAPDPYRAIAERIRHIPVRLYHGAADRSVPVSESRKMAAALRAAGASVEYIEYPGVGHDSWDRAYDEPDLMPRLLAQRRSR